MLAVHFDGMPENEWLMVLHSEDWIDMVTKSHQIAPKHPQIDPKQALDNPNDQRELAYAISHLKASIAKVTKLLDEKTN